MKLQQTADLFGAAALPARAALGPGAELLRGFAGGRDAALLAAINGVVAAAPFRQMTTPGGYVMSVAMTNCGDAGWITDRRGYRYSDVDPVSGLRWPTMPALLRQLAIDAAATAGYAAFVPDACLINRYVPGARMTAHQDRNERDIDAPIVSVSLGLPAVFLFGGLTRKAPVQRMALAHGDVVVWGGATRMAFHGIARLVEGWHEFAGASRINLTFRKAL
ncbi:MAG TPA: DNA oxidative demethylase AlkB [Steroidobacteraceae bacterium]|nr:DNA oxidative demethylase AlkB [Steroidobacteraceae bacterium]